MIFRRRDDDFEQSSILFLLTSPLRSVGRFWQRRFGEDRGIRDSQPIGARLVGILTWPLRFIWSFMAFMVLAWTVSRRGSAFILGLPAVVFVGAMIGVLWLNGYLGEQRALALAQARYQYHDENDADRPELREMFAEKVLELTPLNDPEAVNDAKYRLAASYYASGKQQLALDLMGALAPEDHPGYPIAHTWLAELYLISETMPMPADERLELSKKHFNLALQADENNIMANVGLARAFLKENRMEEAADALNRAVRQPLDFSDLRNLFVQVVSFPEAVRLLKQLGRDSEAEATARFAVSTLRPLAIRNPNSLPLWEAMIKSMVLVQEYDQATALIDDGLRMSQDDEVRMAIARTRSQVLVEMARNIRQVDRKQPFIRRLWGLTQAIVWDFRNEAAYKELMAYIDPAILTEERKLWLHDAIIGSPNPGVVHAIIGMQKILEGEYVDGQKHWKIADSQFQYSQFVINNLITIAVRDYPEVAAGKYDLVEIALELFPDQPVLYVTRGNFYLQDEQYEKAIPDLERAAESLPNLLMVHESLAKAYEAVGETEKLTERRAVIESLLVQMSERERLQLESQRNVCLLYTSA